MTSIASLILPVALLTMGSIQSPPETGANPPAPETEAAQTPIIVEGSADTQPPRAQTGSRIPSEPLFSDTNVATSTGISGLTPGSGMSPFHGANAVSKRTTTSCVSDNDAVGERASCLLIQARRALSEDDILAATDIFRFLVSSDQFGVEERLAGGTELYNLAAATDDTSLREEALIRLIEANVLAEDRRPAARRTLVDMAIARGNTPLAIERLGHHVSVGPPDDQSLANLAILLRETGRPGGADIMQRAIAARQQSGEQVPEGWQDFAQASDDPQVDASEFETTTVILETALGNITIALETERAPITAGNFLRYVEEGRFDGIVFYRAMHVDWGEQPNGLIQGGTQWDPDRILDGIAHEPTNITGLSHTRGALSMAMGEPGTANGDFSIMVHDQTGLDAKPASDDPVWRNGYAVFGYVTDGMEVVQAIHAAPIDPDAGEGWMLGQMLAAPVVVSAARRVETATE